MDTGKTTKCPGCGVVLPSRTHANSGLPFEASDECFSLYNELSAYTLSLADPAFPHQLAVDAYAAQHPGGNPKPIRTPFALVGLYLVVEKGFTGRQAQRVHVLLGRRRRKWPVLSTPDDRGGITVLDVMRANPGQERLEGLKRWASHVWKLWASEHRRVARIAEELP